MDVVKCQQKMREVDEQCVDENKAFLWYGGGKVRSEGEEEELIREGEGIEGEECVCVPCFISAPKESHASGWSRLDRGLIIQVDLHGCCSIVLGI